eukprot:158372_1
MSNTERDNWAVGTKCQIYSRSKRKWTSGQIIKIYQDDEGEWLTIQYMKDLVKDIQRHSKDVRNIQRANPLQKFKKKVVNIINKTQYNDNDSTTPDMLRHRSKSEEYKPHEKKQYEEPQQKTFTMEDMVVYQNTITRLMDENKQLKQELKCTIQSHKKSRKRGNTVAENIKKHNGLETVMSISPLQKPRSVPSFRRTRSRSVVYSQDEYQALSLTPKYNHKQWKKQETLESQKAHFQLTIKDLKLRNRLLTQQNKKLETARKKNALKRDKERDKRIKTLQQSNDYDKTLQALRRIRNKNKSNQEIINAIENVEAQLRLLREENEAIQKKLQHSQNACKTLQNLFSQNHRVKSVKVKTKKKIKPQHKKKSNTIGTTADWKIANSDI